MKLRKGKTKLPFYLMGEERSIYLMKVGAILVIIGVVGIVLMSL